MPSTPMPASAPEGDPLKIREKGVSCESCHGPSSNWVDDHWHPNKWRNNKDLTRDDNSAAVLSTSATP